MFPTTIGPELMPMPMSTLGMDGSSIRQVSRRRPSVSIIFRAASQQLAAVPEGMNVVDPTPEIKDFSDTAAIVDNLDLIISVDTAVIHLAGAMGKPTWMLTPYVPDWRWLERREDTPWYPTVRLLRQVRLEEWSDVMERAAEELDQFVART